MFEALKGDRAETFQQLSSGAYRELRRDFTTVIDKYNAVIADLKEQAQKRISGWVEWCKRILIAALTVGAIIVVLTDRYLAAFVVCPLERIQQHL